MRTMVAARVSRAVAVASSSSRFQGAAARSVGVACTVVIGSTERGVVGAQVGVCGGERNRRGLPLSRLHGVCALTGRLPDRVYAPTTGRGQPSGSGSGSSGAV